MTDSPTTSPNVDLLPSALYTHIFSSLNQNDLIRARQVCRQWRRIIALSMLIRGSSDIRETNLWTLHNRASEAIKPDGILQDPKAVEIYQSIDFDYQTHFGPPHMGQAIRSVAFDQTIRQFWQQHPDGTVVNLGEGLETQRFRLQSLKRPDTKWITVDLPNALFVREQFMPPDQSHIHIATSAIDVNTWASQVPLDRPVMITAQGLFMYLTESQLQTLFHAIAQWFPQGCTMLFDTISKQFSQTTLQGIQWTHHYQFPKMPFGVNRFDAPALFQQWVNDDNEADDMNDGKVILHVREVHWPVEKMTGIPGCVFRIFMKIPILRRYAPMTYFQVDFLPARKNKNKKC